MSRYSQVLEQMLLEGEALVKAGRFEEGEERARSVLEQQPRNAGGHYLMAFAALMQDRHAEALPHVERALRADRVNAQYHFMAALCHSGLGRVEEAIASYRRALQYRPEFFEARANLAYLYECAGRIADAVDSYRRVLEQHPREWYSLNRLGYCERVQGREAKAIELLQRALDLKPDFAPTCNELALALLQLKRTPEAIAMFRRAVESDPQFLAAWCNLGKVLYLEHVVAMGADQPPDPAPVLECFERILALDPGNVEFAYLRDCVAGVTVARPPDQFIEGFFDRFAPHFDEKLVGELRYSGPQASAEFMAPWLAGRSGLRVVDLGCGTGLSGGFLRGAAASLVGVDLSAAMLEKARERALYDLLVQEEIGSYLEGCAPGSIDLAVALEVFLYVGDLRRVLEAAARALAPRGRLLFSVEVPREGEADFTLAPAGRYAHSGRYVEEVARAVGFSVAGSLDFSIRHEANQPVPGCLFALDKPA